MTAVFCRSIVDAFYQHSAYESLAEICGKFVVVEHSPNVRWCRVSMFSCLSLASLFLACGLKCPMKGKKINQDILTIKQARNTLTLADSCRMLFERPLNRARYSWRAIVHYRSVREARRLIHPHFTYATLRYENGDGIVNMLGEHSQGHLSRCLKSSCLWKSSHL